VARVALAAQPALSAAPAQRQVLAEELKLLVL
jgi:hypothetical protein